MYAMDLHTFQRRCKLAGLVCIQDQHQVLNFRQSLTPSDIAAAAI